MTLDTTQPDYDRIWTDTYGDIQKVGPTHRHMERIFREILFRLEYESALNVGCGTGGHMPLLREGRELKSVAGLDISRVAIEQIRRTEQGAFHIMDIQKDKLEGVWDLVFCSLILEHLRDDDAALRNMRAMTGKYLLLSTMSGDIERYGAWERQVGHMRNYRQGELEDKLARAGFEVRQIVNWGFPFFSPLARLLQNRATLKSDIGMLGKLLAELLYWVYFLNSRRKGDLLIILAAAQSRPMEEKDASATET